MNAIPYGLASILMIVWGRSSDRSGERRWHTALTLFLIAGGLLAAFLTDTLAGSVVILSLVLIGAYSMKGPFWALASGWMSSTTAAAGLAAIGAMANLIGGGLMVNVYGIINENRQPCDGDDSSGAAVCGGRHCGIADGTQQKAAR